MHLPVVTIVVLTYEVFVCCFSWGFVVISIVMALGGSTYLQDATMLEQLLEEINFQRTKEMRQLMKDGEFGYFYSIDFYINKKKTNETCL